MIQAIDQIFNNAEFNERNPDESVHIDDSHLEELAGILLACKELRAEFANQVSNLTTQAKKNLLEQTNSDAGV